MKKAYIKPYSPLTAAITPQKVVLPDVGASFDLPHDTTELFDESHTHLNIDAITSAGNELDERDIAAIDDGEEDASATLLSLYTTKQHKETSANVSTRGDYSYIRPSYKQSKQETYTPQVVTPFRSEYSQYVLVHHPQVAKRPQLALVVDFSCFVYEEFIARPYEYLERRLREDVIAQTCKRAFLYIEAHYQNLMGYLRERANARIALREHAASQAALAGVAPVALRTPSTHTEQTEEPVAQKMDGGNSSDNDFPTTSAPQHKKKKLNPETPRVTVTGAAIDLTERAVPTNERRPTQRNHNTQRTLTHAFSESIEKSMEYVVEEAVHARELMSYTQIEMRRNLQHLLPFSHARNKRFPAPSTIPSRPVVAVKEETLESYTLEPKPIYKPKRSFFDAQRDPIAFDNTPRIIYRKPSRLAAVLKLMHRIDYVELFKLVFAAWFTFTVTMGLFSALKVLS